MTTKNKIYFASDFHLGAHIDRSDPLRRERWVVDWLTAIKSDCKELYLLGDVFDYWFEYTHVVPRGYVRLLGKLAELADDGVEIHIFTGNHDVWMFDYFTEQFNAHIHKQPIRKEWNGKKFIMGHGDGLGPGDRGYKFIKGVFSNRIAQRLFAAIHPYFGTELARFFSRKSREATGHKDGLFLGEEEFLVRYCKSVLLNEHIDYFIFGHRHLVIDHDLGQGSKYINLGEWFNARHYAVFDGSELSLQVAES
jgi:UDP-2,3-diacylglucosamine hydrolase